MNVSAITGGENEPSARFRVRQYLPGLAEHNINVNEHYPFIAKSGRYWYHKYPVPAQILPQLGTAGLRIAARLPAIIESYKTNLTWIQREFLTAFSTTEGLTKSPRVFDVDDAIWLRLKATESFSKKIVRRMDGLVCGNSWLADYFSDCNTPTWVIPTGVDTERWRPDCLTSRKELYIGWIGTSGNYQYLYEIEQALFQFFKKFPSAKLLIIADTPPHFSCLPEKNIQFLPWSQDIEVQAVQQMHIGIMPLQDSDWERGKCAFKMLLYMSTGIPVVVSPVGMNREVLQRGRVGFGPRNHSEWIDALTALIVNPELRKQMGNKGREIVEQYYSVKKIVPQLVDIFRSFL
ncbi:MAG: glycosyltransferase family 4 protein [Candidatus Electrothrix communis]|nr:MAG: glycosyltransferase family 4 protein [Candidatus Electrothrix communis]